MFGTNLHKQCFILIIRKERERYGINHHSTYYRLTLIGTVMTVSSGQKKTDHKLEMAQAVTDCKLDELTREVRMHNNFAQRVPVIEEQVKVINHRIADLEEGK